jgi:hypothetical protein
MTTDTLIDVSLEEAEAIMRAEWLRLQHDTASRERSSPGLAPRRPATSHARRSFDHLQPSAGPTAATWQQAAVHTAPAETSVAQPAVSSEAQPCPTPQRCRNRGDALTDEKQAGS